MSVVPPGNVTTIVLLRGEPLFASTVYLMVPLEEPLVPAVT
jgi:hypothetical protein